MPEQPKNQDAAPTAQEFSRFLTEEYRSMKTYGILSGKSRNPNIRRTFIRLRDDEQRHLKLLQTEHFLLFGDSKKPQEPNITLRTMPEMLQMLYKAENAASDGYKKAALQTSDPKLRGLFTRLSEEEKKHADIIRTLTAQLLK